MSMLGKSMGMSMGQQQPSISGERMSYSPNITMSSQMTLVELIPSQMVQLAQMIGQQVPRPQSLGQLTSAVNEITSLRTGKGQG